MGNKIRVARLTERGVPKSDVKAWLEIPEDVASLLLSAGVGLDTWAKFKAAGLTEYRHVNAAIIKGSSMQEITEREKADAARRAEIERDLALQTAASFRTSDWDDTPHKSRNKGEHWYFTPEKIAEFVTRDRERDQNRRMLRLSGDASSYAIHAAIALFGVALIALGVSTGHLAAVLTFGGFGVGAIIGAGVEAVGLSGRSSQIKALPTNQTLGGGSKNGPLGKRARKARQNVSDRRVEFTWETVVKPLIEAGANPANVNRWMRLTAEVRENALRTQTGINMAEKIEHALKAHAVTPMAFLNTLDELAARDNAAELLDEPL